MRELVLDTETTGLDPHLGHRIIEIGVVELINRRLTGKNLHFYINPEREIDAGALSVHGITNDFLADKPRFADIAEEIFKYLDGGQLVIHNAPFDLGFLNYQFGQIKSEWHPLDNYCKIVDTLLLARQKHPGQKNSLDALCKRYNVNNSNRQWHGALLDAHLLTSVYLAMTGGQSSLFAAEELENNFIAEAKEQRVHKKAKLKLSDSLRVIFANSAELQAHERLMQRIKKETIS